MIERFIERVVEWMRRRSDVLAVGLVGSQARGTATAGSDVDLVVIASVPARCVDDTSWALDLGPVDRIAVEDYGAFVGVRMQYASGPEVEFGFTSREWAALPVDASTTEVVSGGMVVLFEREPLLSRLLSALGDDRVQ